MSEKKNKLSRRDFLKASVPVMAAPAIFSFSKKANAIYNMGAFWRGDANSYSLGQSLRLNSAASQYLSRTFTTPTSQKKWTWSGWVKRCKLGSEQMIFSTFPAGGYAGVFEFNAADGISFYNTYNASNTVYLMTNAAFRDTSAWYHIVLSVDTTQVSPSDRVRIYVNGQQITAFSTATYPSQDYTSLMLNQNTYLHALGCYGNASGYYLDGYLCEVHFVDGQSLPASSFGLVESNSGQWIAKRYSGTYGNNGFNLTFADNSNTTAATLGKDASSNGNNWTPNGLNTFDQVLDSPTTNFCTINSLMPTANLTFLNGNLKASSSSALLHVRGTQAASLFKSYFEATWNTLGSQIAEVGLYEVSGAYSGVFLGYCHDGRIVNNGTNLATGLTTWSTGNTIGVATDPSTNSVKFYKDGTLVTSFTLPITNGIWVPLVTGGGTSGSDTGTVNFGQGGQAGLTYNSLSTGRFAFTPPAGFKALQSKNMPAPVIAKPSESFATVLYSGTGTASDIKGLSFSPDLVWVKARTGTYDHVWWDKVRGPSLDLRPNSTGAELNAAGRSGSLGVDAFNADGFHVADNNATINSNTLNYVSWCWKKGVTPGFDIVTYTKANATTETFNHSLGVKPAVIIIKSRGSTIENWNIYHQGLGGATNVLWLNSTNAKQNISTVFNATEPTSTQFTVGPAWTGNNQVAYLFAEVPGFSSFGTYNGNSSANGPFIWCGFRPAFVMVKRVDSASDWSILDSTRNPWNIDNTWKSLWPNLSSTENTAAQFGDFLSNGFKIRVGGGSHPNIAGGIYIYLAFAETPFKYANAR